MPKFSYNCPACLYTTVVIETRRPLNGPLCLSCGGPTQKLISSPNVVIKGAAFKNGYYIPQTNSELGMPTEHEVLKHALKERDAFISHEDKDDKIDWDADNLKKAKDVKRKAEMVKQKNPKLYDAFRSAQERLRAKKK